MKGICTRKVIFQAQTAVKSQRKNNSRVQVGADAASQGNIGILINQMAKRQQEQQTFQALHQNHLSLNIHPDESIEVENDQRRIDTKSDERQVEYGQQINMINDYNETITHFKLLKNLNTSFNPSQA